MKAMSFREGPDESARLTIRGLRGGYGDSQVLHGIDLQVRRGEVVTLLGRNGSGRTSTLRAIVGLLPRRTGSIRLGEVEAIARPPEAVVRLGVGYSPEERGIFSRLSVRENLLLPPAINRAGLSVDDIFEMFPNLRERSDAGGARLSGGEQQMLAIARILRTGVDLLLLDEPTEGLAPVIVAAIRRTIVELKRRGFTILLVEQKLDFAGAVGDRHYLIEQGQVVDELDAATLRTDTARVSATLGL